MNKTFLGAVIVAVVLAAMLLVYFAFNQTKVELTELEPIASELITETLENNSPASNHITELNPNDLELDLTKLQGKDRLYTAEEGRYENLSEEEKKLVKKMYYVDCPNRTLIECEDFMFYSNNNKIRLVALKNERAMIHIQYKDTSVKEGWNGNISIFNIKDSVLLDRDTYMDMIMFGQDYIVRLGYTPHEMALHGILQFYRPGMDNFVDIPDSLLADNMGTYLSKTRDGSISLPIEFNDNRIIAHVHQYDLINPNNPSKREYELISRESRSFHFAESSVKEIPIGTHCPVLSSSSFCSLLVLY